MKFKLIFFNKKFALILTFFSYVLLTSSQQIPNPRIVKTKSYSTESNGNINNKNEARSIIETTNDNGSFAVSGYETSFIAGCNDTNDEACTQRHPSILKYNQSFEELWSHTFNNVGGHFSSVIQGNNQIFAAGTEFVGKVDLSTGANPLLFQLGDSAFDPPSGNILSAYFNNIEVEEIVFNPSSNTVIGVGSVNIKINKMQNLNAHVIPSAMQCPTSTDPGISFFNGIDCDVFQGDELKEFAIIEFDLNLRVQSINKYCCQCFE